MENGLISQWSALFRFDTLKHRSETVRRPAGLHTAAGQPAVSQLTHRLQHRHGFFS